MAKTMHELLLPLIEAIVEHLADLPHKLYDYAPDELAPPYYTISASAQQAPKGDNRATVSMAIAAWTSYSGSRESLLMLNALVPKLHRVRIILPEPYRGAVMPFWQSTQTQILRPDSTASVPLVASIATFGVLLHA